MKILLTGSTGFVAGSLIPHLQQAGHEIISIVRQPGKPGTIYWDPSTGHIDEPGLEGADAVVHLAGENIAAGRWTAARRARIRDSREHGTRLLSESLAKLRRRPSVLVSASAIGYYGDRGSEILREDSPPGSGFLPDVCRAWEAATVPAAQAGIRVACLRFGVILSRHGGALARMLPPFRLGIGGRIGSGRQYMSWISIDDTCGAIIHALETDGLHGPANAVSPAPVTNLEFTKTLARVLRRPAVFPVPAFGIRLLFGEMGEDLLLASARVEPVRLTETKYRFRHENLESALRVLLREQKQASSVG